MKSTPNLIPVCDSDSGRPLENAEHRDFSYGPSISREISFNPRILEHRKFYDSILKR